MGTWGSGNLDNDTAADHLSMVVGRLVREVSEAMAGGPDEFEPGEYWGDALPCQLELLCVLAREGYSGGALPSADVVHEWRRDYMAAWEETIDDFDPVAGFKESRRSVLHRTFAHLAEAAALEARRASPEPAPRS